MALTWAPACASARATGYAAARPTPPPATAQRCPALDYKTDAKLREALAENEKDAAIVVVAQRIATIMHATQIVVLDEGAVVGKGTHDELLRSCPAYLEIAQSQLSAEELGLTEEEIAAVMNGAAQKGGER